MRSNLAVIPARGGSTRLKDKNIYPLGGKPLIRWITETVIKTNAFTDVIISTDSDEIFEAVGDLNVQRHTRSKHLASTEATVLRAMLDLLDEIEIMGAKSYHTFSYFLPTCPFVGEEDIKEGLDMLNTLQHPDPDVDSVVSMTEFGETMQLACLMMGDNVLPLTDHLEKGMTNSKYLKKYYKPSGAFYMADWERLARNRNFFTGNVKGVLVPKERSIDINTIHDIEYAESLLRKKNDTGI